MGPVHGVFWRVEKGAGTIRHFAFDPFSLENHHGFGSLRVAVSRDDRSRGKAPQKKAGAGGGILGKGGEFHARIGTGFPKSGVGKANGGKHADTMPEGVLSDNRGSR